MKIKYYILSIILLSLCVLKVNATNLSVSISCPGTAYNGTTVNCTVNTGVSYGILNGINANYSFENASYQNFSSSGGWSVYNSSSNGFALGNTNGSSGGAVGTLSVYISGSAGMISKISINNIGGSDTDYNDVTSNGATSSITIIEKPIPTTTTSKKVVYLNELSVDGYDIGFKKGTFNYTLDVAYEVSTIIVKATSQTGNVISGVGNVHINEGENSVVVTVTDSNGESSSYTIKVNRVIKVSNIVNNNIDEVSNAFNSNMDLIINLNKESDTLIASKDIINVIKGTKRTITYNILENKDILYSFKFDGNSFSEYNSDIDLSINFKNDKKDIIEEKIKDKKLIYFEVNYKDIFPKGTKLKIKNTTKYHQESSVRLYKLNQENELELLNKNLKIKDNFIEINIDNGYRYILSNQNTKSGNTSILFIIISILILFEIIIVFYLIMLKKKQIIVPKLDSYLDNPDFVDDSDNL